MNETFFLSPMKYPYPVRRIALSMFAIMIVSCSAFAGRGDKAGTAGGSSLMVPIGAQTLGVGGAALATVSGPEASFWNPSGLANSTHQSDLLVSHMAYIADIKVEYLSLGTRLGDIGAGAVTVKSISYGDIPVTTEDQPDGTGEIAHPSSVVLGASFAHSITDQIALGITGNYLIETMERVSASTVAFTVGLQYSNLGGVQGLAFGVVVRNIGPQIQYAGEGLTRQATIDGTDRTSSPVKVEAVSNDLPSTIEIGLGYDLRTGEHSILRLNSAFQNNNFSDDEYRFGAEYSIQELITLRAGTTATAVSEHGLGLFGPAFGLGVHTMLAGTQFRLDYAYRSAQYFSGNHVISIGIGL